MYLKPRTKLRLHFNHDISDLDEINDVYFPNEGHQIKRSPMRRRYNGEGQHPWTEWYSDLDHGCQDWHTADTMIEGFIHKNIGEKFNDVFHEFVNKKFYRKIYCYGYHTPRSMFLDYFEKHRLTQGTYYVDDDGIIRQIPWKPRKPRDIIIYKEPELWNRYTYVLKEHALLSISVPFITLFGKNLYDEILLKKVFNEFELDNLHRRMRKCCPDKVFEEAFNQVRRYRESRPRWYGCSQSKWQDFLFTSRYNNIERIIRYGSREYFKYIKEKERKNILAAKEKRHPDRTAFDETLRTRKLERKREKRNKKLYREDCS